MVQRNNQNNNNSNNNNNFNSTVNNNMQQLNTANNMQLQQQQQQQQQHPQQPQRWKTTTAIKTAKSIKHKSNTFYLFIIYSNTNRVINATQNYHLKLKSYHYELGWYHFGGCQFELENSHSPLAFIRYPIIMS